MNLAIPFKKGWRSPLDMAASLGMNGLSMRGEQRQQLEDYEPHLIQLRDQLSASIDKAKAETAKAESEGPDTPSEQIDVSLKLAVFLQQLKPAQRRLVFAELALETFRIRMGITRAPKTADFVMSFVLLGIVGMLESVGTMSFFLNAHMVAGPMSAFLVALLISFTNVVVSTCAGYFIGRYLDYGLTAPDADAPHFVSARRGAWMKFGVFLLVILGLHLTTGLIRSQEELSVVVHGWSAYGDLLTSPESVFLMLMGICMSAIAFHKGRHLDDPIPGFGERHREVEGATEGIKDLHEETAEEISEAFDEPIETLEKRAKRQKTLTKAQHKTVNKALSDRRNLEQAIKHAESKAAGQLAGITDLHQSTARAAGHHQDAVRNEPVSFVHFLDGLEVPAFYQPPDPGPRIETLKSQKAQTLGQLAELLDQFSSKPSTTPNPVSLHALQGVGGLQ